MSGAMPPWEQITWARDVLELGDTATRQEIAQQFKRLLHHWHPDHGQENPELCHAKTRNLLEAKKILEAYCTHYPFPLTVPPPDPEQNLETWWRQRFGEDPIWS